ncbi:hypothetical protein [Duganella levis]|uniref:Uncharacterized protein n=1 Tax=Duganella levis TaxID=2692169 RepID=A0ABW9W0X1_9BURK|nr:hypothetical protein [Duganella levis]MYN27520.1 hypothetical protein [Duganella levis]
MLKDVQLNWLSAARCFAAGPAYSTLGIFCIICGVFCGMQLLAAMTERGADLNWRPGINFKIVAVIVVVITLCSGYMARPVAQSCAASAQKESK